MWVPVTDWDATRVEEGDLADPAVSVLVDNSALVSTYDAWKQHPSPWRKLLTRSPPGQRVVSDITAWEFLHPDEARQPRRDWLDQHFAREALPSGASAEFRKLLDVVFSRGRRIGKAADGLLMAHALATERVVVTRDIRGFCKVLRLKLLVLPSDLRR